LKEGYREDGKLKDEIVKALRKQIGPIATPKSIHFVEKLPKTRSGKIMRRVLKAIVKGETIGDISTLEDEASVEEIKTIFHEFKEIFGKDDSNKSEN
jgi:acetyl-CoA synthetase